jgi:hypothetical protein
MRRLPTPKEMLSARLPNWRRAFCFFSQISAEIRRSDEAHDAIESRPTDLDFPRRR